MEAYGRFCIDTIVRLSGQVSRHNPVKTFLFLQRKSAQVPDTATFYHYGISPWEIEVIYDTLNRSFEVEEKQLPPDDPQYVSMVEIRFPGFGNNNNNNNNNNDDKKIDIVFPLQSKGDRQFEMGMEKIEYLVDIVPVQLRLIPPGTEEIWYLYDEASAKWSPSIAKTGSINYLFKNNEWKTK